MNATDHLRSRSQRRVAIITPLRRATFVGLAAEIDVGLELPIELIDVAAHVEKVDLSVHQHTFGADEISATQWEAGIFHVNAKGGGQSTGCVSTHGIRDVCQFLLFPLPGQVNKLRVAAHRDDVGAKLLEVVLLLCQSSEFGRSDEGEVGWVEEEDSPLAGGVGGRKAVLTETAGGRLKGGEGEIGDGIANPVRRAGIAHS